MNSEPAVIVLPLSTLENMKMETAWRIDELLNGYAEIRRELEEVEKRLTGNGF